MSVRRKTKNFCHSVPYEVHAKWTLCVKSWRETVKSFPEMFSGNFVKCATRVKLFSAPPLPPVRVSPRFTKSIVQQQTSVEINRICAYTYTAGDVQ